MFKEWVGTCKLDFKFEIQYLACKSIPEQNTIKLFQVMILTQCVKVLVF